MLNIENGVDMRTTHPTWHQHHCKQNIPRIRMCMFNQFRLPDRWVQHEFNQINIHGTQSNRELRLTRSIETRGFIQDSLTKFVCVSHILRYYILDQLVALNTSSAIAFKCRGGLCPTGLVQWAKMLPGDIFESCKQSRYCPFMGSGSISFGLIPWSRSTWRIRQSWHSTDKSANSQVLPSHGIRVNFVRAQPMIKEHLATDRAVIPQTNLTNRTTCSKTCASQN